MTAVELASASGEPSALQPPASVPVLTRGVIAGADGGGMTRTVASNLEDDVRVEVRRAAYPALSAELRDRLVTKHTKEVTAAIPPPVEPEKSLTDKLAVDSIRPRAHAVAAKTAKVEESAEEVKARRDRLAKMPIPMKLLTRIGWSLVVILIAVLVALAVGTKLGVSIDAFVLGPVVENAYGEGSEKLSLALSLRLGILIALGLLVSQAAITVLAPRFVGTWGKAGFIAVDIVFSVAFFYLRSGSGSGQGIAFSLLEASLSLDLAVILIIASARLKANDEHREARSVAEQELIAAQQELAQRTADRDAEATLLQEQIVALEKRDIANRMQTKYEELAAATAYAAYVGETSALIRDAATHPTDRTINDTMRSYATKEEKRLGLVNGHNTGGMSHAA